MSAVTSFKVNLLLSDPERVTSGPHDRRIFCLWEELVGTDVDPVGSGMFPPSSDLKDIGSRSAVASSQDRYGPVHTFSFLCSTGLMSHFHQLIIDQTSKNISWLRPRPRLWPQAPQP